MSEDFADNVKAVAEKSAFDKKYDRFNQIARISKFSMLTGLCVLVYWPLVGMIWWIISGDTSLLRALGDKNAPSPEYARCLGAAALLLVGGFSGVFVTDEMKSEMRLRRRYDHS